MFMKKTLFYIIPLSFVFFTSPVSLFSNLVIDKTLCNNNLLDVSGFHGDFALMWILFRGHCAIQM